MWALLGINFLHCQVLWAHSHDHLLSMYQMAMYQMKSSDPLPAGVTNSLRDCNKPCQGHAALKQIQEASPILQALW